MIPFKMKKTLFAQHYNLVTFKNHFHLLQTIAT